MCVCVCAFQVELIDSSGRRNTFPSGDADARKVISGWLLVSPVILMFNQTNAWLLCGIHRLRVSFDTINLD